MKKLFLALIVILFINYGSRAQNPELETSARSEENITKRDTISSDSIVHVQDSIVNNQITDTLKISTLNVEPIFSNPNPNMSNMNFATEAPFVEGSDSIRLVIGKLSDFIQGDTTLLNDSTKQAIHKLIDYSKSSEIKAVIEYLQSRIEKNGLLELSDSSLTPLNDTINNAVNYLLQRIQEDSIKVAFRNLNNDTIMLESVENEMDSIHINLVDNRGEYAVLWVRKSDLNVFDLYLEDGAYIEKTKSRKFVNHKLDSKLIIPKLKKAKKVEIIVGIWDFEGLADIKFNQGYISKSWAEGGENSLSALSILKYSADYSYGKLRSFDSDVEYRLGYLKSGDNDLQKNDDKFELNAKYGMKAFANWYYSGLLNFKTQILKGYDYSNDTTIAMSEFLSPAYLVFSLGLDYKPSNKLTILFSPLTSKFTIVADTVNYDQTRFGVGEDEFIRKEIGAYIKAISKLKFRDNIGLENKINFFTNYTKNPQNIDVDWEVDLKVKLTDYIKMSINAHLLYDDDVSFIKEDGSEGGARTQFKELFGIGFIYSF